MNDMQNEFNMWARCYNSNYNYQKFIKLFDGSPLSNRELEENTIIKKLKTLLTNSDFKFNNIIKEGTELFRCRNVTGEDFNNPQVSICYDTHSNKLSGFDNYDSKEPPIYISEPARNNIKGASYLYLAEDEYTACAEICPIRTGIISLAKFKVKKDLNIFDFTTNGNFENYNSNDEFLSTTALLSNIMAQFYLPVYERKEYLATQYISDFIRKYGYDGICYFSSITMKKNYTIFNCNEENVEFIGSELVINAKKSYKLYRLNDSTLIDNTEDSDILIIKDENVEKIKEEIVNQIWRIKNNGKDENADSKQG